MLLSVPVSVLLIRASTPAFIPFSLVFPLFTASLGSTCSSLGLRRCALRKALSRHGTWRPLGCAVRANILLGVPDRGRWIAYAGAVRAGAAGAFGSCLYFRLCCPCRCLYGRRRRHRRYPVDGGTHSRCCPCWQPKGYKKASCRGQ